MSPVAGVRPYASGNRLWRRWVLLSCVLVVHAAVWTAAYRSAGLLVPPRQIAAEFLSTFAVVCICINLTLSTRPHVLERWLQGLDKLFGMHRTIGLTVPLIVTTHFLMVPKSAGLVPSMPFGYGNLALVLTVVFIASAPRMPWNRLVTLKYQNWKALHRFNGLILIIAVIHSRLAPTYVRSVPLLLVYVYGIAAIGLAAWLYREFGFRKLGPFRTLEICGAETLHGDVTQVVLDDASLSLPRRAGQFAFVTFAQGASREDHPFTISSAPGRDVRFSIKASGDFTQALVGAPTAGGAVRLEGPYGAFDHERGLKRQLWLAGGIGITPFLAMAASLDGRHEVELVWSVHDAGEAIYADELATLARDRRGLTVRIHPTAELGHVEIAGLETLRKGLDCSVFVCGPVPMRLKVLKDLAALGVPRRETYYEEFRLR